MKKLFYPAIFQPDDNDSFVVSFPDVDGCLTCGDSMDNAYEMAIDALGLVLSPTWKITGSLSLSLPLRRA